MLHLLTRNLLFVFVTALLLISTSTKADTDVTLLKSYAGKINFVGAHATLRTEANTGNACAVSNATSSLKVTGIPSGATIKEAHLYWAGSGSTPDYQVTFENTIKIADRQYTANYAGTYDFFSGVEDVTNEVSNKGNGMYEFSGLTVNTGAPYCAVEGVLAGWSLIIIYEASSELFRVVNLYEGFQTFRNSSISITANNFRVPAVVDGKYAALTWEGDDSINANGENLIFNGTPLQDSDNPIGEQFNSNSNITSIAPSTGTAADDMSHGVDFDSFPVNSLISPGATSANTIYSSGNDLVILSAQILSITNTAVSDLGITKTSTGSFIVGNNATYNLAVTNAGPNIEPGPITVTDSLPAGLTFVSATGTDWTCSSVAPLVTCTRGSLIDGASAAPITLTVAVSGPTTTLENIASVSGTNFDNQTVNDTSKATTPIISGPNITLQKTVTTVYDPVNKVTYPKAIPGSVLEYTIIGINSGSGPAGPNSITISDLIPPNTQLCVDDTTVDAFSFCIAPYLAPPNTSTLSLGSITYFNASDVVISALPADADGTNSDIARMSAALSGSFIASSSFNLVFRVVVQ